MVMGLPSLSVFSLDDVFLIRYEIKKKKLLLYVKLYDIFVIPNCQKVNYKRVSIIVFTRINNCKNFLLE